MRCLAITATAGMYTTSFSSCPYTFANSSATSCGVRRNRRARSSANGEAAILRGNFVTTGTWPCKAASSEGIGTAVNTRSGAALWIVLQT